MLMLLVLLLLSMVGVFPAQAVEPPNLSWKMESSMPTPRGNPHLVTVDGLIYAVSGTVYMPQGPIPTQVVEVYDPSTGVWSKRPPIPEGVVVYALGISNGEILAVTGKWTDDGWGPATAICTYDPCKGELHHVTSLPSPNADPLVAYTQNRVFIFGGAIPAVFKDHKGVDVYELETGKWSRASDMPSGRHAAAVAVVGGSIYVIGGVRNFRDNVSDVLIYDIAKDRWEQGPRMPKARAYFAWAVLDNVIYVAGGQGDIFGRTREILDSAYSFGPSNLLWDSFPKLPIQWAHCKAIILDGRFYVIGGLVRNQTSAMVASIALVYGGTR